jgi:ribosomal protein L34E
MTVQTDLRLFGSKTVAQHERSNPKCPKCGRANAKKAFLPKQQHPTFTCIGQACGHSWSGK